MVIGSLQAKVVLDRNPAVYYGSHDAVAGNIRLVYRAAEAKRRRISGTATSAELFGPLKLEVMLYGRLSIEIRDAIHNRRDRKEFKNSRLVFQESQTVFNGPFKIAAEDTQEFPFTLLFPERARPIADREGTERSQDSDGGRRLAHHISEGQGERLPPSFDTGFHDAEEFGSASIQYYVENVVEMPGIDIKTTSDAPVRISYGLPRSRPRAIPIANTMFEHKLSVSSKNLIAESDRAKGFKGKTKAFFKETSPRYDFEVSCKNIPTHICMGQPFKFEITIWTDEEHTTCSVPPEITLDECKVTINAYTTLCSPDPSQQRRKTLVEKISLLVGATRPEGPFSSDDNYTKSVSTGPLQEESTVPSFAFDSLSRRYQARIDLVFRAAKQKLDVRRDISLMIHPALLQDADVEEPVGVGPPPMLQTDEEQLPAYDRHARDPPAFEAHVGVPDS